MALGLSAVRPDKVPLGLLSEEDLLKRALSDREKRASDEKMAVISSDGSEIWTDYTVTNRASGRSYRVALRGFEPGQSYCSCPDFRKNTLGTCKHIIKVQRVAKRLFQKARWSTPYARRSFAVHIVEHLINLAVTLAHQFEQCAVPLVAALYFVVYQIVYLDEDPLARLGEQPCLERSELLPVAFGDGAHGASSVFFGLLGNPYTWSCEIGKK